MKKILLLLVMALAVGCSKDSNEVKEPVKQEQEEGGKLVDVKTNYPKNIEGTLWETRQSFASDGGSIKVQFHFFRDEFKLIFVSDHPQISRIEFKDRGNYTYKDGKGVYSISAHILNSVYYFTNGMRVDLSTLSPQEQQEALNHFNGKDMSFNASNQQILGYDNILNIGGDEFYLK